MVYRKVNGEPELVARKPIFRECDEDRYQINIGLEWELNTDQSEPITIDYGANLDAILSTVS